MITDLLFGGGRKILMIKQGSGASLSIQNAASTEPKGSLLGLFEAGLCGSLLYGVNLYFSTNADINNPVVPIWWSIAKDVALVLLFGYILLKLNAQRSLSVPLTLVLTLAFAASTAALCLLRFGVSGLTLSFAKNLGLYFAGGAFLGVAIANRSPPSEIAFRMCRAIVVSIVVGIACLLLPVQSVDGRLYGTYGNPTSLAYAAFIAFALITTFRSQIESVAFAFALGAIYVMSGSISLLVAAAGFLFLLSAMEFVHGRAVKPYVLQIAAISVSVVLFGALLHYLNAPAKGFERATMSIASTIQSDSITTRLTAFTLQGDLNYRRYDSFLLGIYKNFGLVPLLMYACVLASLAWQYIRTTRSRCQNTIAAALASILVLNPLLQHQLEIFPTNLLFGLLLGCSIVWLSHQREVMAPETSRHCVKQFSEAEMAQD